MMVRVSRFDLAFGIVFCSLLSIGIFALVIALDDIRGPEFTRVTKKEEPTLEEIQISLQDVGFTVISADFVQTGGFGTAPVQYVRVNTIQNFVKTACDNNVTIIYCGILYRSDIIPQTYWFRLDESTIVALNR